MSKKRLFIIDELQSPTEKKQELIILEELEQFITRPNEEELRLLEKSILKEGIREPLQVWLQKEGQAVLIDGHNRYRIARKHGISYQVNKLHFDSIEEAKNWMLLTQMGRRNLNDYQRSYYRGLQYLREKQVGNATKSVVNFTTWNNTAQRLAKTYQISEKTIRNDATFAHLIDSLAAKEPQLRELILSKKLALSRTDLLKMAHLSANELQELVTQVSKGIQPAFSKKENATSKKQKQPIWNDILALVKKQDPALIPEIEALLNRLKRDSE
jgi:hypothetical protein